MRFRPCVDIHNGKVKQIVGGSLKDEADFARENYVSKEDGAFYGRLYKSHDLKGGHIILLNPEQSSFYEEDVAQAKKALAAFPGGFSVGGGIKPENGERFLKAGASQVIVTSYLFDGPVFSFERLMAMKEAVGKEHLIIDLSVRLKEGKYFVVTNRWQTFTETVLTKKLLSELSGYCSEFLVHAVDVEGKANGIEEKVAHTLASSPIPATYAGGIRSFEDLNRLYRLGKGKVDFTIGSALDIFGGHLPFTEVVSYQPGKEEEFV